MTAKSVRVAIIGGGLAGATLANGLVRIPHIEVQVYESAPEFSERGAAIGLGSGSIKTLEQIIPSARELLANAGAVPSNTTRIMVGSGKGAGDLILDLGGGDTGVNVHRASLLRELLAPLPKEVLHANKRLVAIQETGGKVQVSFEDGTVESFDAVVGADGIFSSVRRHVLQDAADEHAPSPAGFWDSRVLVPYEQATATLGKELFDEDRQYGWTGDGGFVMHDILENRTMVQCVLSGVEHEPPKDRKRPLTRDYLNKVFGDWLDGPIGKGAIDLTLNQSDPQGYSQWEHKSTPTYANSHVCIVGDAAHATSPWQGAGAGQAFEDVMIVATLLRSIRSAQEIGAAFAAYSELRRPRCQRVIDSSRGTGQILCGQDKAVGLDPDKMRAALAPRWAFFPLDLEAYKREALHMMEKKLQE